MQQLDISSILASPAQTALALVGTAAAAFAAWSIVENMPSKTKPPGPWRWPIVGTISLILNKEGEGKVHELLWNLYQKYGKISYIELLGSAGDGTNERRRPVAIVADSELVRHILTAQSEWRRDESLRIAADSLLENALFVLPSGDLWHHHRKNVQPAFGPTHLRQAGHITHSMTLLLCDHFTAEAAKNGGSITVDMHRELGALALDVISNAMQDLHSNTKNIDWDLFEKISEILEDHETTANTLTFVLFELCNNPKMAERLTAEVIETRNAIGGDLNADNIHSLKYMDAFIKEAQRLHSVVPVVARVNNAPLELGGYYFPAKITLAHLVTKFRFELVPDQKLKKITSITTGFKSGMKVKVTPK
eukprot:jgi/Hompol1/1985/HPOL_001719-RA